MKMSPKSAFEQLVFCFILFCSVLFLWLCCSNYAWFMVLTHFNFLLTKIDLLVFLFVCFFVAKKSITFSGLLIKGFSFS